LETFATTYVLSTNNLSCDPDSKRFGDPAASLHLVLMPINPKQYITEHRFKK
jgi:hypothetical protein